MINANFVFVGVIIQFLGGLDYLINTLKGKTKPNKVSWLLWTIAPLIAFAAELKQGVGVQSFTTFIVGFVPLLVLLGSFVNKKAQWEIEKLDIICGVLSSLGILLWLVTKVGNLAILFSIFADGLAFIPTLVKAFKYPETESANVFITGFVAMAITLLTVTNWNFQTFGFPLYLFLADLSAALLIQLKLGKALQRKLRS